MNWQNWMEYDYNPFILFGSDGDICTLNNAAEFFINKVDKETIYQLALTHASSDFGFKTTTVDLSFDIFKFFAITVGYENEEQIGIKLYQLPFINSKKTAELGGYEDANIYQLIDLALVSTTCLHSTTIRKEYDPTLPSCKLPQNDFVRILTKSLDSFRNTKTLRVSLGIKSGEFLRLGDKKYQILELKFIGDTARIKENDSKITEFCEHINVIPVFKETEIYINAPLVQ
jgi:hypothetical protein